MWSVAVGLSVATACGLPALEFECEQSGQCGPGGTCEADTGRCSVDDDTCDGGLRTGGRRYGDAAGEALAGQCVAFTCEAWADCGGGGACEPDGGCSEPDASCEGGRRYHPDAPMLAGECVPLVAGGDIGALCASDEDCRIEGYCASDRCITLDELAVSTTVFATHCLGSSTKQGLPIVFGDVPFVTSLVTKLDFINFDTLPACTNCGDACPAYCAGPMTTRAVAVGNQHVCWAAGGTGCIGLGVEGEQIADTVGNAPGLITQTAIVHDLIAGGPKHTCGYGGLGTFVQCWGDNTAGQLDGVVPSAPPLFSAEPRPRTVSFVPDFLALAAGLSCAASNAAVECWGTVPWGAGLVPGLTGIITAFDVGPRHGCVVAAGEVRCWGDNADRAVDPAQGSGMLTVSSPLPGITVRDVDVGYRHSCAVSVDDEVWCWGANDRDQLDGPAPGPVRAAVDHPPVVGPLAAGQDVTCAVHADAVTRCWGDVLRVNGVAVDELALCLPDP